MKKDDQNGHKGHRFRVDEQGVLRLVIDARDGHALGLALKGVDGLQLPQLILTKPGVDVDDDPLEAAIAIIGFGSTIEVEMFEIALKALKVHLATAQAQIISRVNPMVMVKEAEDGRGH